MKTPFALLLLSSLLIASPMSKYIPPSMQPIGPAGINFREYASSTMKKLEADCLTLRYDLEKLDNRVKAVHTVADFSATALALPSHIASALKSADAAMTTINKALDIATKIPATEKKATDLKKAVAVTQKQIQAAKLEAEKIAAAVEPARKIMVTTTKVTAATSDGIEFFTTEVLARVPDLTVAAQMCAKNNSCILTKFDAVASDLDVLAIDMDKAIQPAIQNINIDLPALHLFDNLKPTLARLDALYSAISAITDELDVITDKLDDLENILDKNVSFNAGIVKIKISVSTAISDIGIVENAIKDDLGAIALDAAKAIGLGKIIQSLKNDADALISNVTKKIPFTPSLAIKDLDALSTLGADITALAPKVSADLPAMIPDWNSPNFGLQGIEAGKDLKQLIEVLKGIKSKGPSMQYGCPLCDAITGQCR